MKRVWGSDKSLGEVSKEEKEILSGAREIVLISNLIPLSDIEASEIEARLNEIVSDSVVQGESGLYVFGMKKVGKGFKAGTRISLSGSLICPKCFSVFLDKLSNGVEVLYQGLSKNSLKGKSLREVLETVSTSSLNKQVARIFEIFSGSSFWECKLSDTFSSLSYFQKIIAYIYSLSVRRVSSFYFVFSCLQKPEGENVLKDFYRALYFAKEEGLTFILLGVGIPDVIEKGLGSKSQVLSGVSFFKLEIEKGLLNSELKVSGVSAKKGEPEEVDIQSKAKGAGILCLYGDVASGKTKLLKNFVQTKVGARGKKAQLKVYYSFDGDGIQCLSSSADSKYQKLTSPDYCCAEILDLKSYLAKTFCETRQARKNKLLESDFLNPLTSVFHCLVCKGEGYFRSELPLGYVGHRKCERCEGSGLGDVFREVEFLGVSYFNIWAESFSSVLTRFEGEKRFVELKRVVEGLYLGNIGLSARFFELGKRERANFLLANILLWGQSGAIFMLEHAFDQPSAEFSTTITFLNEFLEGQGARLIVSSYRHLKDEMAYIRL